MSKLCGWQANRRLLEIVLPLKNGDMRLTLQTLLRMGRPPSLLHVPPEEPPNPFTAQQNPFQPATPFVQVCLTFLACFLIVHVSSAGSISNKPHTSFRNGPAR